MTMTRYVVLVIVIVEDSWSVYLSVNWRLMNLQKSEDSVSKFLLLLALVDSKGYMSEPWTHRWVIILAFAVKQLYP